MAVVRVKDRVFTRPVAGVMEQGVHLVRGRGYVSGVHSALERVIGKQFNRHGKRVMKRGGAYKVHQARGKGWRSEASSGPLKGLSTGVCKARGKVN